MDRSVWACDDGWGSRYDWLAGPIGCVDGIRYDRYDGSMDRSRTVGDDGDMMARSCWLVVMVDL